MESIIAQKVSKIKFLDLTHLRVILAKFFWGILIIMLIILAFFVGRVTKFMEATPAFSFESAPDSLADIQKQKDNLFGKISTSTIVASSGGKKYYFVWCKGAANLKENKKRYFNTEADAQKAGYTLANNCK